MKVINNYPDKFYGFGTVPLGLSLEKTQIWIKQYIIDRSFFNFNRGIRIKLCLKTQNLYYF